MHTMAFIYMAKGKDDIDKHLHDKENKDGQNMKRKQSEIMQIER
jgi:hypothetical protein